MSFVETFINLAENSAVFSLGYISELKKKLENLEGVDLQIVENSKKLSIRCANNPTEVCPFAYRFEKKKDEQSKEIGLEFLRRSIVHSQRCMVNNEQARFERNAHLIQTNKSLIANLMISRLSSYGPETPKKLLQVISRELDFSGPFIYQGLFCEELKRKIKKKFDNLISIIRIDFNIPASFLNSKSTKSRYGKAKAKFTIKQKQLTGEYDVEKISDFFISEESDNSEESLFEAVISTQSPNKKSRQRRKSLKSMKEENLEENSVEDTENDPNTAPSHEYSSGKTKLIKKQ